MIQDIVAGIAAKLDAKYGKPVYDEKTEQDLEGQCFYIKLITTNEDQIIGKRYERRHPFDVHYFPESNTDPNVEIHDVIETLYDQLEYINMGTDLIRAKGMRHEVQGGVLHFLVSYDLIVIKQTPADDPMEELHIIQENV